ncbi:hypothetical protein AAMO2058_001747900, partial [Amorphochlora amoebiformis]
MPKRPPPRAQRAPRATREQIQMNGALLKLRTSQQLNDYTKQNIHSFNLVNCVTALSRLAKFPITQSRPPSRDMLSRVCLKVEQLLNVEVCGPRHQANALWALARICPHLGGEDDKTHKKTNETLLP